MKRGALTILILAAWIITINILDNHGQWKDIGLIPALCLFAPIALVWLLGNPTGFLLGIPEFLLIGGLIIVLLAVFAPAQLGL